MLTTKLTRRLCMALALAAVPFTASAQQVIKITAMDGYPERALWVKEFIEFYMPEVDKRLAKTGKYKIEWQKAFGGQIVKPRGEFDGLKSGLGDMAIITTVFYEDKLPLNNVPYFTPFSSANPKIVAKIIDDLGNKFPAFHKQFTDYNQVVLTNFSTIDDYGIFATKPIKGLADLKGMKLDAAGANALYIKPVGAVGVAGSLVFYYNDVKTGVADGAIIWMEAAITFKIGEVAPNYLKAGFGTGVNKAITVNLDFWKKLPGRGEGRAAGSGRALSRSRRASHARYRRQVDQGLPRQGRQDRRFVGRRPAQMGDGSPQHRQELGRRSGKAGAPRPQIPHRLYGSVARRRRKAGAQLG